MSVDKQKKVYNHAECPKGSLGLGSETHGEMLFFISCLVLASLKEHIGRTHHKSLTKKLGMELRHIFLWSLVHSERSYLAVDHLV